MHRLNQVLSVPCSNYFRVHFFLSFSRLCDEPICFGPMIRQLLLAEQNRGTARAADIRPATLWSQEADKSGGEIPASWQARVGALPSLHPSTLPLPQAHLDAGRCVPRPWVHKTLASWYRNSIILKSLLTISEEMSHKNRNRRIIADHRGPMSNKSSLLNPHYLLISLSTVSWRSITCNIWKSWIQLQL